MAKTIERPKLGAGSKKTVERLIDARCTADAPAEYLGENGDNDADQYEKEPSLGSVDNATNQERSATGGVCT